MLGWASQQFEKLSVAVAPPPTDANGRFLYAVQKGDEEGALGCLHEIDAARAMLNPTKGSYAIHLACQNSMERLIRALLNVPGVDLSFIDSQGNTPLHYATMSTDQARSLPTIKMLVSEYKASPCVKNSSGQTPYDLASLDMVRQYLLPLQLQAETQQAIDNGGVGLPPGIDMGGLRIQNPAAPPPPIMPGMHMPLAPAPMSSPAPHHYQTPQHDAIPNPPASGGAGQQQGRGGYALSGGSSAAIYKPSDGKRVYKADGFHSSSSDVNLQRKYGHVNVANAAGRPPPPSSGNAGTAFPAVAAAGGPPGANPFAGGGNPYASGGTKSRYVAYDAVTGQTSMVPSRPVAPGGYAEAPAPATTPNFAVFSPGGTAAAPAPANHNAYNPAAPAPGQMYQQQPAYQQPHHPDAMAGGGSYPNAAANQHYQNPSQQPQQQYHQGYQQPKAQQPQEQQPAAPFSPTATAPVYGQQSQQPQQQQQQYDMQAQTAAYSSAQPYSQQPQQQQQPVANDVAPPAATQPTMSHAPAPAATSQGTIAASPLSGGFSLAEQQENAASATQLFSSPSKSVASPVQPTSAPVVSQSPAEAMPPVQQNQLTNTGPASSASDIFASDPETTDAAAAAAASMQPAAASFAPSPAPQQAAPASASDIFGSPAGTSSSTIQETFAAPGNNPAPSASQVIAANNPPQGERAASPAASDELLDDVPLSPDGKPTPTANASQYSPAEASASQGFAEPAPVQSQNYAAQGFAQPAPVQSQNFAGQGFAHPAPAPSHEYASQGFAQPPPIQTQNPPDATAVPGAESLFAAIGMPPPPFSTNRR